MQGSAFCAPAGATDSENASAEPASSAARAMSEARNSKSYRLLLEFAVENGRIGAAPCFWFLLGSP